MIVKIAAQPLVLGFGTQGMAYIDYEVLNKVNGSYVPVKSRRVYFCIKRSGGLIDAENKTIAQVKLSRHALIVADYQEFYYVGDPCTDIYQFSQFILNDIVNQ